MGDVAVDALRVRCQASLNLLNKVLSQQPVSALWNGCAAGYKLNGKVLSLSLLISASLCKEGRLAEARHVWLRSSAGRRFFDAQVLRFDKFQRRKKRFSAEAIIFCLAMFIANSARREESPTSTGVIRMGKVLRLRRTLKESTNTVPATVAFNIHLQRFLVIGRQESMADQKDRGQMTRCW